MAYSVGLTVAIKANPPDYKTYTEDMDKQRHKHCSLQIYIYI